MISQYFCAQLQQKAFVSTSALKMVKMAFERYGGANEKRTNPLVVGHGLFGQKRNWNSLCKEMQKRLGNQTYAIDFRNHGDSPHDDEHSYRAMVSDLDLFIREVVLPESGYERVFLLGHSMGGKVVAQLALSTPKEDCLIEKLIVEDIAPHRSYIGSEFLGYIQVMKAVDLTKSRKEIFDSLKAAISNDSIRLFLMTNLDTDPSKKNRFRWKCNLDAIEKNLNHTLSFAAKSLDNASFSRPTLVVSGANSSYIKPGDSQTILKSFPNAEFSEIPDAGHWLHSEKPALFLDCVVDFLKKE